MIVFQGSDVKLVGLQGFVYKQLEWVSVCVQEWRSDKLFEKKLLPEHRI